MSERVGLHRGVVRGGVVVPEAGCDLPDGTAVEFGAVKPLEFTPEERAEFEAWDRLSEEAWRQIDWGDEGAADDAG